MKLEVRKKNSSMKLTGEITIYTVSALNKELNQADEKSPIMCDLSSVNKIDTAGFQLLLFLKKNSEGSGRLIEFISLSKEIKDIFDLYGESLEHQ